MNYSKEQINTLMSNLRERQFDPYYVDTKEEVVPLVENMLSEGWKVSNGGSRSLAQTGVMDLLKSGKYQYFGLGKDMTEEERRAANLARFDCDVFLLSANAITMDGRIYQEDGSSNRVAPMIYGPKNVIMVVGLNKVVETETQAKALIKKIAPVNNAFMGGKQPCVEAGHCVDCKVPLRSCCTAVCLEYSRIPNRIKVILVGDYLGYELNK